MPAQDPARLDPIAREHCERMMADLFSEPVWVQDQAEYERLVGTEPDEEPDPPVEWDGLLLRHVYGADFIVWRDRHDVTFEVDDQGRVVRFADASRLEPPVPPTLELLSDEEIIDIARTTGHLDGPCEVESAQAVENNFLEAVVVRPGERGRPAFRVELTINPAARSVAKFAMTEES